MSVRIRSRVVFTSLIAVIAVVPSWLPALSGEWGLTPVLASAQHPAPPVNLRVVKDPEGNWAVTVSSLTSSGATIAWATIAPADTQVVYGVSKSFGSASPLDPALVRSHAVTLSGLGANTLYYFRAQSRDASGHLYKSATYSFRTLAAGDTTAPAISITAPAAGATVSGTVTVSATASDNVGVAGVQFRLDGAALGGEDSSAPYSVAWNTANAAEGEHTLTAVARDAAGNARTSAAVTVTVSNGPVVLVAPADTSLNLDATNYSGVALLTTYTWPDQRVANAIVMKFDLSSVPAGSVVQSATLHLALVESDATSDATYSVTAHKIVGRNPAIGAATGYTADGVTPWTANTCCSNNVPMAQADISPARDTRAIDKAPGFKTWTITGMVQEWLAEPSTNFGVLLNSDTTKLADRYRYFASMEHADPQLRPYLRIAYGAAPPDPIPPAVGLTAPAPGATVSGSVTVTASASDNVGVVGVQFKVDGTDVGAQDTTPPYSVTWNTTTVPNGSHALTAVARDAAGNQTTSGTVTVTVSNAAPPDGWTNEPAGFTVIEDTGWEDGTLGDWYRIFSSSDKPIGVKGVTDSPLGEARALQIDYLAGHVGGGGTELRYDIPAAARSSELYVGYYVQVSPGWQGHSSGINKMIYLHDGGQNFAAMWYEMFGSGASPLDLYVVNQSGSGPGGMHENVNAITFVRGQWHKVEIYQKQGSSNNGIVRVWVDGVLAIDRSDVDTTSNPVDNITISGIWGGVGDSKNQADFMRFDRIRISRPGTGAPPPPPSEILIEETFEDANLASRGWYDDTTPLLSTAEHVAGSARSIEYRFNAGSTTPTAAVALRRTFTPTGAVYLRYHVKYSTNWVGSEQPYHPHEFHFLTNRDGQWSGLSFTHLTVYVEQNGGTPLVGIQDGANVDQARVGQDLTSITELRGVAGCNGSSDGYPDNCYMGGSGYVNEKKWTAGARYFSDTPGAYYKSDWHLVEAYVKLNTISGGRGINDGVIQYWFDGQPVIDRRNVLLRTAANAGAEFNQIVIAPYIGDGSPVAQSFWIDNVTVATARP
ncbi:MAG TPA: Ig-like domain-containing protein [Vicinamibacterales bacterium]|nr:Ig-like domain-containing protein [Vicinamibacterales bacterium]